MGCERRLEGWVECEVKMREMREEGGDVDTGKERPSAHDGSSELLRNDQYAVQTRETTDDLVCDGTRIFGDAALVYTLLSCMPRDAHRIRSMRLL